MSANSNKHRYFHCYQLYQKQTFRCIMWPHKKGSTETSFQINVDFLLVMLVLVDRLVNLWDWKSWFLGGLRKWMVGMFGGVGFAEIINCFSWCRDGSEVTTLSSIWREKKTQKFQKFPPFVWPEKKLHNSKAFLLLQHDVVLTLSV